MPTYQYSCTECGHAFEQVQSFTEDSLTTCPVCQGRLRKVFNAVGVVFKGSGFYRTDSRAKDTDKPAAAASGEKSGATTSGASADKGASDKPASPPAGSGGSKGATSAA